MFRKLKLDQLNRLTIYQYRQIKAENLVLVLDNIRSMHNVGSIFRTADGFGISKIYLCGITGTPPHREIHKTALGAEESVEWEYNSSTSELCKKLKEEGFTLVALEQAEGSVHLQNFKLNGIEKYAIIFGNEVDGVSEDVLGHCSHCIEIPQFGTKHSFNVSVSAGIALWQLSQVQ